MLEKQTMEQLDLPPRPLRNPWSWPPIWTTYQETKKELVQPKTDLSKKAKTTEERKRSNRTFLVRIVLDRRPTALAAVALQQKSYPCPKNRQELRIRTRKPAGCGSNRRLAIDYLHAARYGRCCEWLWMKDDVGAGRRRNGSAEDLKSRRGEVDEKLSRNWGGDGAQDEARPGDAFAYAIQSTLTDLLCANIFLHIWSQLQLPICHTIKGWTIICFYFHVPPH